MQASATQQRFAKTFLLILAIGISLVFFFMVRRFLVAVLMAAIFSGMSQPVFRRLVKLFRGNRKLASVSTILLVLLLIILPLAGFLTIVASQAVSVTSSVRPWVEQQIQEPDQIDRLLERIPFLGQLAPYTDQIAMKIGEWAGNVGNFLISNVAQFTAGTVAFFLHMFIMLYAMFFFLLDGRAMLDKILYYVPLAPKEEEQMVARFVSVTRATIKGSLIIGIVQGALAGLGLYFAGIGGAAFWGTVMAVLSIIPGVGTALVWVPAAIYLFATGHTTAAILLSVWCIAIVGTVDNVLRPWLVGRDTKMSDLLILLSTLGGLLMFGALGIVIGPIVAALFVTVWELYGVAFKDWLPEVREVGR